MQKIPEFLKRWNYQASCVVFKNTSNNWRLIYIKHPKSLELLAGLAIDIGTSRVALRIINLTNGKKIIEESFDNPQIAIGPDILTRLHHSNTTTGLQNLNSLILDSINQHTLSLCHKHNILPENIHIVSVAGNTTMTHFFLGISTQDISKEPYTPTFNTTEVVSAKEIGLNVNPNAQIFTFPNVGSYFGGDLIAGILQSGLNQNQETSILVDVGTNAEIVLGNKNWMIACAGAAGPALESSVTQVGAMAETGIIDRVTRNIKSKNIEIKTIGNIKPKGICGSGIIDLAAQLFLLDLIDVRVRGNFVPNIFPERFITKNGITNFIIVPSIKSATGKALTLAQTEMESLIQSKAAMYTILETLTNMVGIKQNELHSFFVSGTFCLHINPKSAITIGMFPDIPIRFYHPIGNSSLDGATRLLESTDNFDKIEQIRSNITYIELNVNQDFMNRFSAAKFLPHTDDSLFPNRKNLHFSQH